MLGTIANFVANIAAGLKIETAKAVIKDGVPGGYNPYYIRRPLIGENNAPQYAFIGQQIATNSPAGGGTIPLRQFSALATAPLVFAPQMVAVTSYGTLTQSREYDKLVKQPTPIGPGR